jgi:hydroxyethylthiazole kinase-like uncharacterized protein yjeF
MERLVTAAEMREMDRTTIEQIGIPGLLLMEHAGIAIAERAVEMLSEHAGENVTVVCGKGNNGGDGFVVARLLAMQDLRIQILLIGDPDSLQGDALVNYRSLCGMGLPVTPVRSKKGLHKNKPGDLVIDALFGTGIQGEVKGLAAQVIDWMNHAPLILSIDMPSGLHCDNGQFEGACVEADATVTLGELKRGLVIPPGRELAGSVDVAAIGIPEQAVSSIQIKTWLIEEDDCCRRLPPRPPAAHKGDFGKALILAGSRGMTGAATLTSLAALKAGCGLVKLGCPFELNPTLETKLTEVITHPLPETGSGSLSLSALTEIQHLINWADVLAIGPGLSQDSETCALIRKLVRGCRKPTVLDADGLNAFDGESELLQELELPLIITPHPGELARLINREVSAILTDPVETARKWSSQWHCVLILKGAPTIIASRGTVYVNSTGNSGMATAGSGDVLTGLLTGLLAQGCSVEDASICGVMLHGLAGDLAALTDFDRSMTAGDILEQTGSAFKQIEGLE